MSKEALRIALEALEYWDVHGKLHQPTEEAITAIKQALEQPVQEFVCSTGLCHYKPKAADLQAELDVTNKQVEILSDALAESRREVAALKAVQEPVGRVCFEGDEVAWTDEPPESGTLLYTTPPAAQRPWVGLTNEERLALEYTPQGVKRSPIGMSFAIEANLKELNT
jgi:hypothetical protein